MTPSRYRPYPDYRDSGMDWLEDIPRHSAVWRDRHRIEVKS
jgi:hypothetical protein